MGPFRPYPTTEVTDMTTMTANEAHAKLVSMGFRSELGSSRYRNAEGDIGRRIDASRNSYEDRERIEIVRKDEQGWFPEPK